MTASCEYCDDCTGMCTNPESPVRADECPVPDTEGVCKFEKRERLSELELAYRQGVEDMRNAACGALRRKALENGFGLAAVALCRAAATVEEMEVTHVES